MKQQPPHLPSPSCSVPLHHHLKRVPLIIGGIFVAWLAGFSAALMAVVWWIPAQSSDALLSVYRTQHNNNDTILPDSLDIDSRFVRIYGAGGDTSPAYTVASFIERAPIMSSDGWVAVVVDEYKEGMHRSWRAIDRYGKEYLPLTAVYEPTTQIVYVQFQGIDFRAVSFATDQAIAQSALFIAEGNTFIPITTTVNKKILSTPFSGITNASSRVFPIQTTQPIEQGTAIITSDGTLAGIVGKDNSIISSAYLRHAFQALVDKEPIRYIRISVEGQFVDAIKNGNQSNNQFGLLITKSLVPTLLAQDIIVAVDGKPLEKTTAYTQLLVSQEKHILSVIRNGILVDIDVTVSL